MSCPRQNLFRGLRLTFPGVSDEVVLQPGEGRKRLAADRARKRARAADGVVRRDGVGQSPPRWARSVKSGSMALQRVRGRERGPAVGAMENARPLHDLETGEKMSVKSRRLDTFP